MTHQKKTNGSNKSMRRALLSGAIVSSLVIASLAPASAGCLSPQVRINAQLVNYSNTQPAQLGVNWNAASNQQNVNLGWAPTDDLRVRGQYNYGGQLRPEPQAFRGRSDDNFQAALRYAGEFGAIRVRAANTNRAAQVERVDRVGYQLNGNYRIPNVTVRGETIISFRGTPRFGKREVILRVTPSYRPNSER